MNLLKNYIEIPERILQGDFVLKLTEGIAQPQQTLKDYVVTPELVKSFEHSMDFIHAAVRDRSSKAAYLHGSFGSGKSHFMAVLSLMLAGNAQARSIPALAPVVEHSNAWTQGKKFLVVPYHMIGADSMESAILGQYAEHVLKLHPDAPVPGFYLAEGLFRDAVRLREQMGDEAFFGKLNEGRGSGGGGWGDLEGTWDARSFEAAMLEGPTSDERLRLVGDLIDAYFGAYRSLAASRGEAFVPLDQGLSIMSKHAKALGYDAVILFLDELILWLASHAADMNFISHEGTKLVKLVEATHADRPIPLISFVARQRDLRELVGETLAAGSVQTQFNDSLRHWEARFEVIKLEDRNLPAIAEQRVLRPVSAEAKRTLDDAFRKLLDARRDVLEILQTDEADREMFRKLYPFSPALVGTLVAVSSVLQRERTALKLMMQLLVDRRDELEVGQVIGVGDLWDVIASGDQPFSEGMRVHFDNAKRLWQQKLLPLLERQHGISWAQVQRGEAPEATGRAFRSDARVLKTLLLAALVPEVKPLRALTAPRLTALNHGSFQSPIPGREAQDVLRRLRAWAGEVGEIKISDDQQNPVISIQVTGVDLEPVLENARIHDNLGNRRIMLRQLLFAELELDSSGDLFTTFQVQWRGTRRDVDISYENVRLMSEERLHAMDDRWLVVLDYPLDDANFGPADDVARLQAYTGPTTRTIAWLPVLLSERAQRDLSRLVILDYLLTGEQRFLDAAAHLSPQDRTQARALASNQRDQLRVRLRQCLEAAYGLSEEPRDAVDRTLQPAEQIVSLEPTFRPQRPVGANLKTALAALVEQALEHQFPAHPTFDAEVRPATLRKVWAEVERAAEANDARVLVADRPTRDLVRKIVDPLKLGVMAETHLRLEDYWTRHFQQLLARNPGPLTVGRLRGWTDEPQARGLPAEVQNLVILTFAAQTSRSFRQRGGPANVSIESLPDDVELVEQRLPSADQWKEALRRMQVLFGSPLPEALNAANVQRLEDVARAKLDPLRATLTSLDEVLRQRLTQFVPGGGSGSGRLVSTRSALALSRAVALAPVGTGAEVLAAAELQTSDVAVGSTLAKANELDGALRNLQEDLFSSLVRIADARKGAAERILAGLVEALQADEHAVAFVPRLRELQREGLSVLAQAPAPPPRPEPPQPPVPPPGVRVVRQDSRRNLAPAEARRLLADIECEIGTDDAKRLSIEWTITEPNGKP
jgi:hypothetical protein